MDDAERAGRTGSLRARQVEQTRAALLDAAQQLFAERGFAATSVADVVAAAEVTKGALYHHFDTKEALFADVFERVEAELQRRTRRAARSADTAAARLRQGFDAYLDAALEPTVGRIVLIDAPAVLRNGLHREIERRYSHDDVVHTLTTGLPRAGAAEIDALATMLLGALARGAALVAGAADPGPTRRAVGQAMHRLLAGLDGSTASETTTSSG